MDGSPEDTPYEKKLEIFSIKKQKLNSDLNQTL